MSKLKLRNNQYDVEDEVLDNEGDESEVIPQEDHLHHRRGQAQSQHHPPGQRHKQLQNVNSEKGLLLHQLSRRLSATIIRAQSSCLLS